MRSSILFVVGTLVLASMAAAADAAETAAISGSVVSTGGLGVPGALVTIVHRESGRSVTVTSGERGVFRAGGLMAGACDLTAEARGYLPASASLELKAGRTLTLDLRVAPSNLEESLTVTATAPRESLEAAEIRESPARDVGEALSTTPGVWTLRKGGIANEVVVRGFQSRDLNLLIDGQRVYGACPNHMDPPAFHVDFSEVDRIEVGKGPFDVRNQGSLGGVVNIVTRRPEDGWQATPNIAGGSWGYVNPSATVSYGAEKFSVLAGYSHRSSKAYRDGSGARFTEATNYAAEAVGEDAFSVGTGWARTSFEPVKGHAFQVAYTRQQADQVFYPYLQMDAVYDDTDRASVGYEYGGAGVVKGLTAQAYYTQVKHWMTDEWRTSAADPNFTRDYSMGSMADTWTGGGRVEARLRRVTLGVEAYRRFWGVTTYLAGMMYMPQNSLPGVDVSFAGVYAETQLPVAGRWSLRAGARWDRAESQADENKAPTSLYAAYNGTLATSRDYSLPSGNARFIWRNDSGVEFAAGIGTTARVPEPNESYFALKRGKRPSWVGNPELDASRNSGVDLSVTVRRSGLFLGASLFGHSISDNITVHDQAPLDPNAGLMKARSYTNNDATHWGGEIGAAISATDRLSFAGEVSYIRGRQDQAPDKEILSKDLAEMPPLRFRSSMRFNAAHWWAEAEGVFAAEQSHVDADLLEEPTPSWAIMNMKAGMTWGGVTFSLGVSNLFDRRYTEHLSFYRDPYASGVRVYEPGRGVYGNVAYRF